MTVADLTKSLREMDPLVRQALVFGADHGVVDDLAAVIVCHISGPYGYWREDGFFRVSGTGNLRELREAVQSIGREMNIISSDKDGFVVDLG